MRVPLTLECVFLDVWFEEVQPTVFGRAACVRVHGLHAQLKSGEEQGSQSDLVRGELQAEGGAVTAREGKREKRRKGRRYKRY
jgi:hypothetical protein